MPLLGFLTGLALAILGVGVGFLAVGGLIRDFSAAARWGLAGAIGLGIAGTATLFWGVTLGFGTLWLLGALWVAAAVIGFWARRNQLRDRPGENAQSLLPILLIGGCAILLLLRLPAALSPSDAIDWDSISHQMAMAKIWLQEGRITYIEFMHHSNIPATVNMLYLWGLWLQGQFAAKTVAWTFAVFAALTVGGLAAQRYGRNAGNWAALAFLATPVVLWEAGSAYVDIAHGLWAGGAMVFAALWAGKAFAGERDNRLIWLAGIMLGFALASKYTGFQFGIGLATALIGYGFIKRAPVKAIGAALAIGVIALAISSPWYIRNIVNTGNPVYPFFYSVFGGRNWSEANAEAYSAEQATFGIGQMYTKGVYMGRDPLAIPGSVTALALHPDKQINLGAIWGAVGPIFVLGLVFWPLSGRLRREETVLLLMVAVTLLTWFYLTQQSRYIIGLMVPGAFLIGGAVVRLQLGYLAGAAVVLQSLWTLYMFGPNVSPLQAQLDYLTQQVDKSDYLRPRLPFWEATEFINRQGESGYVKVALYEEVRGFYLDVDYFWANPGHHTMIPYEDLNDGVELVKELRRIGTTHVYINMDPMFVGPKQANALQSMFFHDFFPDGPVHIQSVERFRMLLVDAYYRGLLEPLAGFNRPTDPSLAPRSILLRLQQPQPAETEE